MESKFDVDLVYTWVDGNDPAWRVKHDKFTGRPQQEISIDANCEGRYVDNDELRYSLRSVEKYAPWIRKIFIVTDNQVPSWLDTSNPKIRIVDHKEIIPEEGLPCFNSNVIEHNLHKIPDLAEHFIYANDDMFINRAVSPATFFTSDGKPIIRLNRSPLRGFTIWLKDTFLKRPLSKYNMSLRNASKLIDKKYGKYMCEKTHHNIDAYSKKDYAGVAEVFKSEIEATFTNHLREDNDIQRILYSYVPLINGSARKEYVTRKTSFMLRIHKPSRYKRLEEYNPFFFCLNDSQYASDEDRVRVKEFLRQRFPDKSQFEK